MSINSKDKTQLTLYSQSNSLIEYHGRHSYKVFKNIQTENCDLGRTLLNNCSLQNCSFSHCSMDSIDYQGTEFDNCRFFNVSFRGADISSCIFKLCTFENCEFSSTNLIDNNILLCTINTTKFDCATVNNNIWTKCEFIRFAPDDTSIYSNEFIKCKFINSALLSAIYYTIFDRCNFVCSEIDSYILGFQFGLSSRDLRNLDIEHFGEKHVNIKYMRKMMHMVYDERLMPLENKILDLIFTNSLGVEIEQLVNLIFDSLAHGLIIKVDEIRFIRKIINNLYRQNKIPLFYFLFIIEKLKNQPILNYRNILSDNVFNEITMFYHLIYSIKMEIEASYHQLCDILENNIEDFHKLRVEFVYKEKPTYRVYEIMKQISNNEFLPIYESAGSFHECYEITKEILENISIIMTIIGTSASAIIIAVKKIIKKRKRKKEKAVSFDENFEIANTLKINKEIIIEETDSTKTYEIIEKEVSETNENDQNAFIRETIFNKTVHTVIKHKETIVLCYDKKNYKKIIIK